MERLPPVLWQEPSLALRAAANLGKPLDEKVYRGSAESLGRS